jgi:hypothetical protein
VARSGSSLAASLELVSENKALYSMSNHHIATSTSASPNVLVRVTWKESTLSASTSPSPWYISGRNLCKNPKMCLGNIRLYDLQAIQMHSPVDLLKLKQEAIMSIFALDYHQFGLRNMCG